ncbi:TetR/AcrR family transcriptional regulator [Longispora fulva]|uniref:AcrR family transcriptional regulator n=1 Tax=Longispora fulva TaxID=619741 RepID=A0A8J7H076_9ACTN|nr:TetR/AcrR family transcriptional regulator [Longispora fulva]MBG6141721.1 AcrR family transcriptional regulator [Longispora fulva]
MTTTKSRRLPRAVRERQMLDAAVAVFAEHGYHAASMDEIAERAGISKPMVYAYLGTKEELFVACINRESELLMTAVAEEIVGEMEPDERLWRGLRAFLGFVAAHRDAWIVLYRQARSQGVPFASEVEASRTRVVDAVAALLGGAAERMEPGPVKGDLAAMATALVGAGEALADWIADHPDADPEAAAARLMNLVWLGFGTLLTGARWTPPAA